MRWLIKSVLTLLSILMLSFITLLLAINTEIGTQVSYQIAKYFIPGKLTVSQISGKLASHINIRKLHYSLDGKDIRADRLKLRWRPFTVFKHHLKIQSVVANGVTIKPSQNDQAFPAFNLSLIGDGKLDDYTFALKLNNKDSHWHGVLKGDQRGINIKTLDSTLLGGDLKLTGSIDWQDTIKIPNLFAHLTLNEVDILLQGSMAENFLVKLEKLNIKSKTYGHYSLEKPTSLTLNPEHMKAEALCFRAEGKHKICFDGDWYSANHFKLSATAPDFPIDRFNTLKKDDLTVSGLFSTKIDLQQTPTKAFTAHAKIHLTPGTIELPGNVEIHHLKYNGGDLIANMSPAGTVANLDINFVKQSHLKGQLAIDKLKHFNVFKPSLAIRGLIDWRLDSIDFVQSLLPNIDNLRGKIDTQFKIAGTLSAPKVTGAGQVNAASFNVPALQSHLHDLTLKAKASGQRIDFNATAKAGTGDLNIDGNTDFSSTSLLTKINIQGEKALLINLPQAKVYASPDINLELDKNSLTIRGDINIPSGEIRSYQFSDTESLPDDVVIIDPKTKKPQNESDFTITSDINLNFGDNINIEVEGLKAKLNGQLNIKDEPQKPTTASGQLSIVNGSFELYGTKFSITRGKLNYHGGPISNPGLNIRAIRSFDSLNSGTDHLGADKVIFGVTITGTAKKPQYQLFAEPGNYSQADILAYLFTGQPLSQAGESQAKLLLQAASLVNIGGEGKLSNLRNEIKDTLGLSLLDIETTSDIDKKANRSIQHTALVLGKYLSPKLYIRYSFDILDHSNKLNIRYIFNKNWSIQTESTTSTTGNTFDNGVDVLYTIERD